MIKPANLIKFQNILKDYQPSTEAIQLLKQLNFVVLLGPSASGKNTIIQQLLSLKRYYYIVSDTTRAKRMNDGLIEKNGQNYWFTTEEKMLDDLQNGLYLEAEIIHSQQVSGISLRELNKIKKLDKIPLADMDIGGVKKLLELNNNLKVFLILPPSFEVWLKRLKERDSIDHSEIKRRLKTSLKIYEAVQKPGIISIINDDYKSAAKQIDQIINGQPINHVEDDLVNKLLTDLVTKTEDYLKADV